VIFTSVTRCAAAARRGCLFRALFEQRPGISHLATPIATVTKVDVQAIRTEDFLTAAGENLMLTESNIIDLAYSVRWDYRQYKLYLPDPP
jgi:membrane protease subunit HflK